MGVDVYGTVFLNSRLWVQRGFGWRILIVAWSLAISFVLWVAELDDAEKS